eukprot:Selendium_serpulae@DN4720_c1_g1_i1.p2
MGVKSDNGEKELNELMSSPPSFTDRGLAGFEDSDPGEDDQTGRLIAGVLTFSGKSYGRQQPMAVFSSLRTMSEVMRLTTGELEGLVVKQGQEPSPIIASIGVIVVIAIFIVR